MAKSGMRFKGRELFIAVSRPKGGGARGGMRGRGRSFGDSNRGMHQHCTPLITLCAGLSSPLEVSCCADCDLSRAQLHCVMNKQKRPPLHNMSEPTDMQAGGFRGGTIPGEAGEAGAGAEEGTQGTETGRLAATGAPPLGRGKGLGITQCTWISMALPRARQQQQQPVQMVPLSRRSPMQTSGTCS